jgi:hypothetical protein
MVYEFDITRLQDDVRRTTRAGLLSRNEILQARTACCSYCKTQAVWAQAECRSCGAPIEWPREAVPPSPAEDCCTGEDPREAR